jgi:hypothetical protein
MATVFAIVMTASRITGTAIDDWRQGGVRQLFRQRLISQ